ncbi:hypothetical protein G6L37_03265 [Agrobacterium rubi]|nr:hypothetical protein [Agrobacterium rubi]NTF24395.1 hypothetical protein [Agrobacterium rubi]
MRAILWTIWLVLLGTAAAWMTHVVFCIIEGRWGFLIAGALAFPIAIIHGVLIWLGLSG